MILSENTEYDEILENYYNLNAINNRSEYVLRFVLRNTDLIAHGLQIFFSYLDITEDGNMLGNGFDYQADL